MAILINFFASKHVTIIYGNIFLNNFYKINKTLKSVKINFLTIVVQDGISSNCYIEKFDTF